MEKIVYPLAKFREQAGADCKKLKEIKNGIFIGERISEIEEDTIEFRMEVEGFAFDNEDYNFNINHCGINFQEASDNYKNSEDAVWPEDNLILGLDKYPNEKFKELILDNPKRGNYHIFNIDINEDGIFDIIVMVADSNHDAKNLTEILLEKFQGVKNKEILQYGNILEFKNKKVFWDDLKDGDQIEALQDIYELNGYSIGFDKYKQVFITGSQFKEDFKLIAKAGDIGIWNKETRELKFNDRFKELFGFGDIPFKGEEKIINKNIFKVLY